MSSTSNFFRSGKNIDSKVASSFNLNIENFNSINEFWEFITKEEKWYLKYSPFRIRNIDRYVFQLESLIITQTNELRKNMNFTNEEYAKVIDWDNFLILADMNELNDFKRDQSIKLKQYCCNCGNETVFTQRYPKHICKKCYSKICDSNGKRVEFFNSEVGVRGFQGYYVGTKQQEKYNSECCYINDVAFYAKEARFGGIVIQLKE